MHSNYSPMLSIRFIMNFQQIACNISVPNYNSLFSIIQKFKFVRQTLFSEYKWKLLLHGTKWESHAFSPTSEGRCSRKPKGFVIVKKKMVCRRKVDLRCRKNKFQWETSVVGKMKCWWELYSKISWVEREDLRAPRNIDINLSGLETTPSSRYTRYIWSDPLRQLSIFLECSIIGSSAIQDSHL